MATRSLPKDLLRGAVGDFDYLSQTEKEITGIGSIARQQGYSVDVTDGVRASEESFKALSGKNSPAIIHLATHGFFFPDPKNSKKDEWRAGYTVFQQSENPLMRSGLALAGANNAWNGKPVEGVEDGILTAYEVSNMYLPNTQLVVLSACETGLGDIQGGEGVYGLQRAFKMAGVKNLVMSLWKVDDITSSEFMQEFYKNIFLKQSIQDAFAHAQTVLKNKYRNDPYKWAAWILVR
jgi:CHAT domain-containing protein